MSLAVSLALFAAALLAVTPGLAADHATLAAAIDAAQASDTQRSRILTGISAEGALVETYAAHGQIHKIVVEALGEHGRRLSTYYLQNGTLFRVRDIDVRYSQSDLARVPPHKHLEIAPGDTIAADVTCDLSPFVRHVASASCDSEICSLTAQDLAARAAMFLRLMNTRVAAGDDGEWRCVPDQAKLCASFTHDGD